MSVHFISRSGEILNKPEKRKEPNKVPSDGRCQEIAQERLRNPKRCKPSRKSQKRSSISSQEMTTCRGQKRAKMAENKASISQSDRNQQEGAPVSPNVSPAANNGASKTINLWEVFSYYDALCKKADATQERTGLYGFVLTPAVDPQNISHLLYLEQNKYDGLDSAGQ